VTKEVALEMEGTVAELLRNSRSGDAGQWPFVLATIAGRSQIQDSRIGGDRVTLALSPY